MEQPPFPWVLVMLVAFFGFVAMTAETLWIAIVAGLGALFVAAAAVVGWALGRWAPGTMHAATGHATVDDGPEPLIPDDALLVFLSDTHIGGPAGSDILLPIGGVPDLSKGRCSDNG